VILTSDVRTADASACRRRSTEYLDPRTESVSVTHKKNYRRGLTRILFSFLGKNFINFLITDKILRDVRKL